MNDKEYKIMADKNDSKEKSGIPGFDKVVKQLLSTPPVQKKGKKEGKRENNQEISLT